MLKKLPVGEKVEIAFGVAVGVVAIYAFYKLFTKPSGLGPSVPSRL